MDKLNLKAYLANVGMTMTEFGNKINYDRTYLSMVSSGKVLPGRKLARQIFDATNGIVHLQTKTKKSEQNNQQEQKQNCDS